MARIRTVKPELARHEGLFNLEQETKLPIRFAWAMLPTACDKAGRFKWRPNVIKLDVLPYDDVDFSRVLDALLTRGYLVKYRVGDEWFGCIPTFSKHQNVNNKERESDLPSHENADEKVTQEKHEDIDACVTRDEHDDDASSDMLFLSQGEGKGRELEGKGRGKDVPPTLRVAASENKSSASLTFAEYSKAYFNRYQVEPVRNAKVNAQFVQLVKRLGAKDAPHVAAAYIYHNASIYVRSMHCVDLLVRDAEKLRSEWASGKMVTETEARQTDRTQNHFNIASQLKAELGVKNGN